MKRWVASWLLIISTSLAFSQAVRVDVPIQTSGPNVPTSGGPLPQALWVANATVAVCAHPSASYAACVAAPITTYTDSSLSTPCDPSTPIVQLPGNTCSKFAGAAGNIGLWYNSGGANAAIDYYVTSTYGTFGPYTITQGGGGGGAGNPAPPAFAAQFANSVVNAFQGDAKILINPTVHSFQAPINSGFRYATGFGDGSTNGISAAAATGQTVVSDPSYPTTEQYGFFPGTGGIWTPLQFHWTDQRTGIETQFYKDWPLSLSGSDYVHNNMSDGNNPASLINCVWTTIGLTTGTGQKNVGCVSEWMTNITPGWSANASVASGHWKVETFRRIYHTDYGSGITETSESVQIKNGVGDNTLNYCYVYGHNGNTSQADEAEKCQGIDVIEVTTPYTGACATGCTTGSTLVTTTPTGSSLGNQGTGRYVFDQTSGLVSSGTISSIVPGVFASTKTVTLTETTGSHTASNAWGVLAGNVTTPTQNQPPWTTSETFSVTITTGTFDNTHLMCMGGQFHEQFIPVSVGAVSGGAQSITALLRRPQQAGAPVMQGGACGSGLELPNLWTIGPQQYLGDVIGSKDTSTVEVTFFSKGAASSVPENNVFFSSNLYAFYNIGTLASTGTAVSGNYVASGSTIGSIEYGQIVIRGASDSAYNEKICTSVLFSTNTAFTCTMAGLSGSHSSATAQAFVAGPAPVPTGAIDHFNLWNIAEVLDVRNLTVTPPAADGTLSLEPNIIPIAASDVLSQPNHISQQIGAQTATVTSFNDAGVFYGMEINGLGQGDVGGNGSPTSNAYLEISNLNGDVNYIGGGGYQFPPNGITMQGGYYDFILAGEGPVATGFNSPAFIQIHPTTKQLADVNYGFPMISSTNSGGGANQTALITQPNSGNASLITNGILTFQGTAGITLSNNTTASHNLTVTGTTTLAAGATVGGNAIVGSVSGSSTAGNIATMSGTSGSVIQDSGVAISSFGTATAVTLTTTATPSVVAPSGFYYNQEATAATAVTYPLPAPVVGLQFCFKNDNSAGTPDTGTLKIITANTGTQQITCWSGCTTSAITASGYVQSSGAAGDGACVVAKSTTQWDLTVSAGVWAVH